MIKGFVRLVGGFFGPVIVRFSLVPFSGARQRASIFARRMKLNVAAAAQAYS